MSRLRVPLSRRSEILWQMHCVLDAVEPGRRRRERFAVELLRRLGVPEDDRARIVTELAAVWPRDLGQADMAKVLGHLERVVPFEWHDDLVRVDAAVRTELLTRFTSIIQTVERPSMPKPVAKRLWEELRRVLAAQIDVAEVEILSSLENVLLRELWRSEGKERQLAVRLLDAAVRACRIV